MYTMETCPFLNKKIISNKKEKENNPFLIRPSLHLILFLREEMVQYTTTIHKLKFYTVKFGHYSCECPSCNLKELLCHRVPRLKRKRTNILELSDPQQHRATCSRWDRHTSDIPTWCDWLEVQLFTSLPQQIQHTSKNASVGSCNDFKTFFYI